MAKKQKRTRATEKESRRRPAADSPIYETLLAKSPVVKREFVIAGALFAVALAIRTIYFFVNKTSNPLFEFPILDALFHHEWAKEIAAGNFWGDEVFFRAPLYPYLLAFVYKISGESIAFATYLQHVTGSLSVVLVYLFSRQYFSVRVSVVAGLLAALYWPLIYFEGDLLIVTLIVFLDLALLLGLSVAIRRQSKRLLVLSGVVLGLSAIARPSILALVPVLPVVFHLSRRSAAVQPAPTKRAWLTQTVLVAAGALTIILPVVVRNFAVGRDFVPIASQGGVNFYIGNNPQSNGSLAMVPGARADMHGTYRGAIELAEAEAGRSLKPSEVSNYYTGKALAFITGSPGEAGKLFAKKFYLFWAAQERSNNKFIQFFWDRFGLGRVPLAGFWLIGPLGLLGAILLWRRRRQLSLLYLFVLAYMAGVVLFFVNGRFRLPVTPVLIVFAAYGIFHVIAAVRSKSPDLPKVALILLACVAFVDYDYISFRGVRALDEAISHYELGNAYLRLEDKDAALAEFEDAYSIQVRYPTRGYQPIAASIDFQIGTIYWEKGLYARAIEALERIPDAYPRSGRARWILAECYINRGRIDDAIRLFEKNPNDARSLTGLGVAYRMQGDYERSEAAFNRVLELENHPEALVRLELARTLALKGDVEGAVSNYRLAAANSALRRDAYLELARLLGRTGDSGSALELLRRLSESYPNDPEIRAELNALRESQ